jgi:hypothetical protein
LARYVFFGYQVVDVVLMNAMILFGRHRIGFCDIYSPQYSAGGLKPTVRQAPLGGDGDDCL